MSSALFVKKWKTRAPLNCLCLSFSRLSYGKSLGRWEQYGPELCRLQDRHDRDFCLGPTHEEVITDLAKSEIRSYKRLPINYFQIQTKFRDEIRPRFGVMRSREFVMKDAYSFHIDQDSLEQTYWRMHEAYSTIFTRLGLNFRPVEADTGSIGGSHSHEFHMLADSGEDSIAFSSESDFAANVELAEALMPQAVAAELETMTLFNTPDAKTIDALSRTTTLPQTPLLRRCSWKMHKAASLPWCFAAINNSTKLRPKR